MSRKRRFFVYVRSLGERAPHMRIVLLLMILAGAIVLAKPSAARDATLRWKVGFRKGRGSQRMRPIFRQGRLRKGRCRKMG